MSFADLRKNSQAELDRIAKETERLAGGGGFERDPRYWRPALDAAGNGSALIRFLPRPEGEEFPLIKKFSYGFKGPTGRWFIENSPQTIGLPCPVNERWSALWNEGTDEAKERSKTFKRRMSFVSNIVVLKHPARVEDEGKVFLYEYGKKIYDKLMDKMNPAFPDIKAFNPFDIDTGANFRLRIMKKDGFTNYDKSEFDAQSPLADDDATMERVWKQCHSLAGEIKVDKFKSYSELKNKLEQVMGDASPQLNEAPRRTTPSLAETETMADTPPFDNGTVASKSDDSMDWYRKLAQ